MYTTPIAKTFSVASDQKLSSADDCNLLAPKRKCETLKFRTYTQSGGLESSKLNFKNLRYVPTTSPSFSDFDATDSVMLFVVFLRLRATSSWVIF